ncbi:Calcium-dependent protein kinase 8 [Datura stramonium]|uniref:Calcium-dependent protein kinase 8 n=1 Tax=Datura stramonium TaxID=4076 RepID=A0ABS8SU63_DATST|nr:Calcium-dependent protein kinase 8 [Datura stramonium]
MLDPDPSRRLTAQQVLGNDSSLSDKDEFICFSSKPGMKERGLSVIAEFLSAEEVAGMKEAFEMMDTEKKGKINLGELKNGLQNLGHQIPDADLQILMEAAGVDGDGNLTSRSGYIEMEELHNALSDEDDINSEEVINAIMHDVDTDKDGGLVMRICCNDEGWYRLEEASRQYSRERFNSQLKIDEGWLITS